MLEILGEVGRKIGRWASSLPEPETKPLFTPFYPSRIGDPFEGIFWSGALTASMARFRQQEGQDDGSVDTSQGRE